MGTVLFFETLILDFKPYPIESSKYLANFYTDLLGKLFEMHSYEYTEERFVIAYNL